MQDIIIIGAGGQAKNTSLVIEQCINKQTNKPKFNILGIVDDDTSKTNQILRNYKVLGTIDQILKSHNNVGFVFAIGSSKAVEFIVKKIKTYQSNNQNKKFSFPNIIHPTAQITEKEVTMGKGNIIFPNCIFFSEITMGNFNFFNRSCSISHETTNGDYNFIHAGIHLSGQITIKNKVWIGVGSTVIQCLTLNNNCTIGAGAVVIKDVEENAIMVGNPAKLLRYKTNNK